MPTAEQIDQALATVEQRLLQAARRGINLRIAGRNVSDDWLYVVITPTGPGGHASDYARLMSEIERDLSEHGMENVLLVPAIED